MNKRIDFENKRKPLYLMIASSVVISVLLSACSGAYEKGESLVAADEMKEGPGIFSGSAGGFYLVGGEGKGADQKPVTKMSLDETSRAIDQKLEQLKRDQVELEALKRNLNKKL